MIKKIKLWLKQVEGFARKHVEYLFIISALVMVWTMPIIIRSVFDPTASVIDPGNLSAIVLAVVSVFVFITTTWWVVRAIWPSIADYFTNSFMNDFKNLEPWQKIKVSLFIYFILFASLLTALIAHL